MHRLKLVITLLLISTPTLAAASEFVRDDLNVLSTYDIYHIDDRDGRLRAVNHRFVAVFVLPAFDFRAAALARTASHGAVIMYAPPQNSIKFDEGYDVNLPPDVVSRFWFTLRGSGQGPPRIADGVDVLADYLQSLPPPDQAQPLAEKPGATQWTNILALIAVIGLAIALIFLVFVRKR
jgi:hypothetical protein